MGDKVTDQQTEDEQRKAAGLAEVETHSAHTKTAPELDDANEGTTENAPTEAPLEPANDQETKVVKTLEDAQTDTAVDEITKHDADAVLAAEDAEVATAFEQQPAKSRWHQVKDLLSRWWQHKRLRWTTIAVAGVLAIVLWAVPVTRYFMLNTLGVRASATVVVLDDSTGLPLKNVAVHIGAAQAQTDNKGTAQLKSVRLGRQELRVERVAFAPLTRNITVGWGSNPLGSVELKAVGLQYTFGVTDYLSGKAILEAEATSGAASAYADKSGKITLTVEETDETTIRVAVTAKGYRTETLTFAAATKDTFALQMVPAQPLVYVTKQSGRYDVYRMDVDGKNKKMLLAGTGRERQDIGLSVHPDGLYAAVVSTRNNKRDSSGYLLNVLTTIELESGATHEVESAQSIHPVGWAADRLLYRVGYAAPSAATGERQRIIAYNVSERARAVLASSDYFNAALTADNYVYYAISASDPKQSASFARIRPDGSGKQVVLNKEVWGITTTTREIWHLQAPDGWYEYTIGQASARKGNPPPDPYHSPSYVTHPDGATAWVDQRDGKGTLLATRRGEEKEKLLASAPGLSYPVRWLNATVLSYRVQNGQETAEYVVSTEGGSPKKLTDVTATFGQ